jgi:hypothetical protein
MRANIEPDVIDKMTTEFVQSLPVAVDPYYQEAALKFIIREFAWALHTRFPKLQSEIADQLEVMASAVREHKE